MHDFLYDNKWLAYVIALVGLSYSGYLYFKAFAILSTSSPKEDQRRRRPRPAPGAKSASPTPTPSSSPSSATTGTGEGHQEDLLTRLAREEEEAASSSESFDAREAATRTLTQQADAKYRSTHILKRPDDLDAEAPPAEPPARDAVRAAVEESFKGWGDEPAASTAEAEPLADKAPPEDEDLSTAAQALPAEAGHDSALTRRTPDTHDERKTEVDDEPPQPKVRKLPTGTEVIRRAKRIEEIGLHKEIQRTEVDQASVHRISEAERSRRLSELGIDLDHPASPSGKSAETQDTAASAPESKRMSTTHLDSILGRLDNALDAEAQAPAAPESTPTETESTPNETAATDSSVAETPAAPADSAPVDASIAEAPAPAAPEEETAKTAESPAPEIEEPPKQEEKAVEEEEKAEKAPEPAAEDSTIPDWARADTFDDDDNSEGEQQKLF